MPNSLVFKRKIDKQIIAGWVLACIPFSWACFSLFGLIGHPKEIPYVVFLGTAPITLPLAILVVIVLLRMSTAVFTIDETKIVIRDFLYKKEILWSNIADVQHDTTSVNGIQTARALSFKDRNGKVLISFPCPAESSFAGDGNLLEILLSIYSSSRQQRVADLKKAVPQYTASGPDGVAVYQLNVFYKIFLHFLLVFVLIGVLGEIFSKPQFGDVCFGLLVFVVIVYLGLINLHSRYELTKSVLQYSNIFQKKIEIPWVSISHITHNTGLMNNIILQTASGEIKLRGVALLNGSKLAGEISLRRQIALEEKGK